MINLGITVLVILLIVGVVSLLLSLVRRGESVPAYESRVLLSPAEARFYSVLVPLFPDGVLIFAKVRLADVLRGRDQAAFNRVSQKHLDFVLVRADDFTVFGVIELDDSSHAMKSAARRDAFKDAALASAGVKISRIRCQSSYDSNFLASQISADLGL